MIKRFTQSIIFLLFLNILVKPFWIFAIDRTVQNRVGAAEYGMYFSLFSFSLLLNMMADLGITNYNNRYIAQNRDQLRNQLGMIIPVKLLLGLAYLIFTLITALFLDYSVRQLSLLIWLLINQMLVSLTLYLRSNISALQLFNTDSLISVTDKFIMIALCSFFLWGGVFPDFRIEWLVYIQTLAYTASFILVLFLVIYKSGKPIFSFNARNLKHTLQQSFPFALLALLMISYTRIDAVMLERMLPDGKAEAGIYAQAFRISDALTMFGVMFASILLPLFAHMLKDKEPINATLSHSFALLMIPSLAIIIALIFSVKPFMELLYFEHSDKSAEILVYLLIGFGGICVSYIFGTLLTSAGKLKVLNIIAFTGLVLNVSLNFVLIPGFGSKGAAIASMCTQLLMGALQALLSFYVLKIRILSITPVKYGVLFLCILLLAWFLQYISTPWFISIFVVAAFSLLMGLLLKLIKLYNLLSVFK